MPAKPLHAKTQPLYSLLCWLVVSGGAFLILKWIDVVPISGGWLIGFWTAVGLVFLDCVRSEVVHANDLPEE